MASQVAAFLLRSSVVPPLASEGIVLFRKVGCLPPSNSRVEKSEVVDFGTAQNPAPLGLAKAKRQNTREPIVHWADGSPSPERLTNSETLSITHRVGEL
jgi:hypothetical protein